MNVLETQLEDLLDSTESQHGFWLKNNREIIEEDLKSGIVRFGLSKMITMLDDWQSKDVQYLYKKIEASK